MAKLEIVRRTSFILSRGWGDPKIFAGRKQDALIADFVKYLEAHRTLIGASMKLEHSHALNEKGVDLMMTLYDFWCGFQIKVESDVERDNFSENVKRQILDSQAHKLDKMYILLCVPFNIGGKDRTMRINSLINDLSVAGTNYHATYPPQNAARFFDNTLPLTEKDLRL